VIAFAAPLGLLWLWLAKRKLEPNSVVKFGLGFLLLGAAFYVFKIHHLLRRRRRHDLHWTSSPSPTS
jgi:dipeptide/tripeptide permease